MLSFGNKDVYVDLGAERVLGAVKRRKGDCRAHGSVIHIDIKGDKIWIQHDGTAPGVALDLVETGMPGEAGARPAGCQPALGSRPTSRSLRVTAKPQAIDHVETLELVIEGSIRTPHSRHRLASAESACCGRKEGYEAPLRRRRFLQPPP